jgi:hypothetical protein
MDAWNTAVEFLLIGDRAKELAEAHPLTGAGGAGGAGGAANRTALRLGWHPRPWPCGPGPAPGGDMAAGSR